MFPHGAQKLLGWFGGFGFYGNDGVLYAERCICPGSSRFLVIMGEFFGSLALIAGFFTRFVAASFVIIMVGAIATSHLPHGFFMNWSGQQQGEGYEYHLLVIGMSLALMLMGAGRWSVDRMVAQRMEG